jgi:hypothetical protein
MTTMTADRLRRIHDVTDNFFFWQGLRWIPLGAAMLAYSVMRSADLPTASHAREWIALSLFALALWLSTSVLGRYYARHFGCVRGDASRHVVRTSVKWFVVYPAIVVAMLIDLELLPPLIVSALAFALAIEAYRQSTGGGRGHYTAFAIGLVAFSILPFFGAAPSGKDGLTPLIGILGLIYIVGGVLDHRELVRTLAPIQEDRHVASV